MIHKEFVTGRKPFLYMLRETGFLLIYLTLVILNVSHHCTFGKEVLVMAFVNRNS